MTSATTSSPVLGEPALSPATQAILHGIADGALREQVDTTVRCAIGALDALGHLHLPQDDFEAHAAREVDADWHLRLAPQTMASLSAVNRLLAYVMTTYDAPAEMHPTHDAFGSTDVEFDTDEGHRAAAAKPQASEPPARVVLSQQQQVAEVAHLLSAMLRARVVGLGERLGQACQAADTWPLLAELDDSKHQLSKAVQGVLFGVLGVFAADASREAIWPAYRSAVKEAVDLRSALTALTAQMRVFAQHTALAQSPEHLALLREMADTLSHFSTLEAYRSLRASDKKAVIEFRQTLLGLRHVGQKPASNKTFHEAMADFQTFLGAMYAINHREVLLLHDRQLIERSLTSLEACANALRLAPAMVDQSRAQLDAIVEGLTPVYGRSVELDDARLAWAQEPATDAHGLLRHMRGWQDVLTPVLSTMA